MLIAAVASSPPNASPLDVQMALSSDTILLGEPLWVDVRVTNRSSAPISVDLGSPCLGPKPLVVEVPDAEPRVDREQRCGSNGNGVGSCWFVGSQLLAPGATLNKRYLFGGAFRITHAATYAVRITKPLRYGPAATPGALLPETAPRQSTVVETTLTVLPPDPDSLLAIERDFAVRATATVPPEEFPPHADIETVRRVVKQHREVETIAFASSSAILEGLAAYPAQGMEPFFASRLDTTHGDYGSFEAAAALYHLNSALARADLAKAVQQPSSRNTWFIVHYLGLMGDPSYLPLVEHRINDPDPGVRQSAVLALGILGGETALPRLGLLIQNARSDADQNDAILALGNTATLKAVPFLISLFDAPNRSAAAGYSLFLLTHHQLSPSEYRTPQDAKASWRSWWAQNQTTARAYHPWEDCPDEKDFAPNTT